MKTLAELVQALPVELYDIIYDQTFTATARDIEIDRAYKPPSCLQVNRSTRSSFEKAYYSATIFYIDKTLLTPWITSLPSYYIDMLDEVRIAGEEVVLADGHLSDMANRMWGKLFLYNYILPYKLAMKLKVDALRIKVRVESRNEESWVSVPRL